ncbi:MAG: TAXI family TRAP transporter solute-binding subunit [Candidatus Acidiferrales bacterium]
MKRSPFKFVFSILFLLFTICAVARAQSEKTAKQIADENKKADQAAFQKDWDEHCKADFDNAKPGAGLRLLTGPTSGYYYMVGKAISAVVAAKTSRSEGKPLDIEPISTEQTKCNLLGLETKNTEFALVQSDIAHDAWFGHPPIRMTQAQDITLVAPLYVEAVHIVIRPHLNLAHLSDLRGRRVWLGIENSLTVLSARRILDAAGLTGHDIGALDGCPRTLQRCPADSIGHLSSGDALAKLHSLDLDAVFQVGAVPFDSLRDKIVPNDTNGQLLDSERKKKPCDAIRAARLKDPSLIDSELHLFNLDVDLVQRLVADGSYIEQLIPPDAYCQGSATLTVGVRALLLTNLGESDPDVRRLATTINVNQQELETNLRRQVEVEQQAHGDPITGLPAKLALLRVPAPGTLVVRYHPEIAADKIYFNPWKRFATRELPLLAAGLLVFIFVLYGGRRVIGPWFARRGELAIGLPLLAGMWVVTSCVLKYFEGSVNEDFSTLSAALLSTFEDLIGFGNGPITQSGQQWWSRCRWLALAIFGTMLLPYLRQLWAKGWKIAQAWLLRLGHAPAPATTPAAARVPDTSSASDHSVPSPTH